MQEDQEITLYIQCHNLPGTRFEARTAVRLGIQKGKEIVEDVLADVESVRFVVPLRVRHELGRESPNFLGPFAHGTPQERFLYLCWGERFGPAWDGFRRAKILLRRLSWEQLEASIAAGKPIEIVIDMTDAKGGPRCGSVRD